MFARGRHTRWHQHCLRESPLNSVNCPGECPPVNIVQVPVVSSECVSFLKSMAFLSLITRIQWLSAGAVIAVDAGLGAARVTLVAGVGPPTMHPPPPPNPCFGAPGSLNQPELLAQNE